MPALIKQKNKNIFTSMGKPPKGFLGECLKKFDPELIIGHPTFNCEHNIGDLMARSLEGTRQAFKGIRTAVIVSDGTYTDRTHDRSHIDAAIASAQNVLGQFSSAERKNVFVYAGPHEGYHSTCYSTGKGNAIKMIFDEMAYTRAKAAILLDGDLRNDLVPWYCAYKKIVKCHEKNHSQKNYLVTAQYARHFVDASISRFFVGPLTTLFGSYVPGGISGDIMLNAGAVAREREANWTEDRRNYGTDIATTLDSIADGNTIIYQAYLGIKNHDVTDDSKLAIMPEQVIGAGLERLLHYEKLDNRVTRRIRSDSALEDISIWDSNKTKINFSNPEATGTFNIDAKREILIQQFDMIQSSIKKILSLESYQKIANIRKALAKPIASNSIHADLLTITPQTWIELFYEVLGYFFSSQDIEGSKKVLTHLYTAAFTSFCIEKLNQLGYATLETIRAVQKHLKVTDFEAKYFYMNHVDKVAKTMAIDFYKGRKRILDKIMKLSGYPHSTMSSLGYG